MEVRRTTSNGYIFFSFPEGMVEIAFTQLVYSSSHQLFSGREERCRSRNFGSTSLLVASGRSETDAVVLGGRRPAFTGESESVRFSATIDLAEAFGGRVEGARTGEPGSGVAILSQR